MSLDLAALRVQEFRRILLIKMSALGDVVHTVPVLNRLRQRYPQAQIDWLLRPQFAELMRHHPAVSNVVEIPRAEGALPWLGPAIVGGLRRAGRLRAAGYDLVLDMQGQLRTGLLALAAGAPVRIGFDRPRAQVWEASARTIPEEAKRHAWKGAREGAWLAYTHHITIPTLDVHAVDRYLTVGALLGFEQGPPDFSFPIPAAAETSIDGLLRSHGVAGLPLLVMAPGTIWETKHWRADGFAEVARHFMARGFAVVLAGSARERETCEAVAALAPGAVNLAGETTLSELAALIRRATLCLTNDSGPTHLAVALERPVVSIFGPTDPVWVGPYRREGAVLQSRRDCVPCYLRSLSRCPFDHACMREVTAAAVIDRIEWSLAQATRQDA